MIHGTALLIAAGRTAEAPDPRTAEVPVRPSALLLQAPGTDKEGSR